MIFKTLLLISTVQTGRNDALSRHGEPNKSSTPLVARNHVKCDYDAASDLGHNVHIDIHIHQSDPQSS